jgi:hypothetical protein
VKQELLDAKTTEAVEIATAKAKILCDYEILMFEMARHPARPGIGHLLPGSL